MAIATSKAKKTIKKKAIIDDEIPLGGIFKCHCGNPISGAASRGKSGKYFYYYKCRHSRHNNISAIKAHNQLSGAFGLMSLPEDKVDEIRNSCHASIDAEMRTNKEKLVEKKKELQEAEEKLYSMERLKDCTKIRVRYSRFWRKISTDFLIWGMYIVKQIRCKKGSL